MKALVYRLARFIFYQLPVYWRYQLHRNRYSRFEKQPQFQVVRQNLYRITLTPNAFIDVFWKKLPIGMGSAASVVIHDQEVLRLDCFGEGIGHLHIELFLPVPALETRLFFSEQTISQQIDRAVFEVTRNLYYYTQRSPYADVRKFRMNEVDLQVAGEQMRQKMQAYIPVSTQS